MPDRSSPPTPGAPSLRVPTAYESTLVFFSILAAVFLASAVVSAAAVAVLQTRGLDVRHVLEDPANNPLANDPNWIVGGTLACEAATLAVVVVALRWMKASVRAVLPFKRPSLKGLTGSFLVVFGFLPLAEAASDLATRLTGEANSSAAVVLASVKGCSPMQMALVLFGLAVVPAVVEESAFRGLITAAYRGSDTLSLFVPSFLFGLFHVDPAQAAATMVLGFGFGLARLCTGSLVTSMVTHAVYNGTVLVLLYASPRTGAEETTLLQLLGGLAVAAGGIWLMYPRVPKPSAAPSGEAREP